jgi:Zn-dependent peptidase ImmA (M78 family)
MDRLRFSVDHELGHIVMHKVCGLDIKKNGKTSRRFRLRNSYARRRYISFLK